MWSLSSFLLAASASVKEEEGLAGIEVVASVDTGVDGMEVEGMGMGSNMVEEDNVGHIAVEEVPLEAARAVLG